MPKGNMGRAVTRDGVKGHMVEYSQYEKFVPDTYKDHKKEKK